MFHCVN